MRRLVIDTVTRACSVALFDDMDCIAARHELIGRGHAERLVPMIAELPDKGRADAIAVNIGPGSFTGIRVGISAAKALALAWGVGCSGYGALALLAAIARDTRAIPVDVAIGGGHGELFFQSFDAAGVPLTAPASATAEVDAGMSQAPIVAGDAAEAVTALRGAGLAVHASSDASAWPMIAGFDPLPASAAYVRAADAKLPGSR